MSRIILKKTVRLNNFGEGWEEAYLTFKSFTVQDLKDKILPLSAIDSKDTNAVVDNLDNVLGILAEHFIEGKAPDEKNELINVTKEAFKDLPLEIINFSLSFLSTATPTMTQ